MTAELSKTFCILPWIHIYANPDGTVLPCCVADHHKPLGNVRTNTIEEIWNNDKYKTMRRKMLAGESCEECTGCYKTEATGVLSTRQSNNNERAKYIPLVDKTNPDGSLDEVSLKYFDIRWSNICNFKCRSCSGTYSSSWATEDNENGMNRKVFIFAGGDSNDELFNQFVPHFPQMDEIYFAGGEPLLTDKHYDMLEHLISIGKTDVKLRYNTNLSVLKYKSKSVIDLWKQFSNISIFASIDSWGERAEYIREGTDWEGIKANIRTVRELVPHAQLQMSTVVSAFNVYTLPEFLNHMFEEKLFTPDNCFPSFYNLLNPHYYSADIIPVKLRQSIIDKLKATSVSPRIDLKMQSIISYLENATYDDTLRLEFLDVTDHYDDIRGRNFVKTFPELAELYS